MKKCCWNRPGATAAVLGDCLVSTMLFLGYFDRHGHFVPHYQAKKEVIVFLSNGKNVYPEEIEAQLSEVVRHLRNWL